MRSRILIAAIALAVLAAGCTQYAPPAQNGTGTPVTGNAIDGALNQELSDLNTAAGDAQSLEAELLGAQ